MNKSNGVSDQCISWGPKARLTVGYRCQIGDVLLLLFMIGMMMCMIMIVMLMMKKKVGKLMIMCDETLKTLRKLREYFFSEKILSFSE